MNKKMNFETMKRSIEGIIEMSKRPNGFIYNDLKGTGFLHYASVLSYLLKIGAVQNIRGRYNYLHEINIRSAIDYLIIKMTPKGISFNDKGVKEAIELLKRSGFVVYKKEIKLTEI